jgi:hypothetical protein
LDGFVLWMEGCWLDIQRFSSLEEEDFFIENLLNTHFGDIGIYISPHYVWKY